MHVSQLMTPTVITVAPDATAEEAAKKMTEKNVGSLVVVENDRLVGILVDRQIVTHVVGAGKQADQVKIKEIMTKDPKSVKKDDTIFDACKMLADGGFRRAPVLDGNRVVGILSLSDVAAAAECLNTAILSELRAKQHAANVEHGPALREIERAITR